MSDSIKLKLRNKNLVPPGGYRFYIHELNKWSSIEHNSLTSCLREAVEFYKANNFPVPQDFAERIETELCENLGPEWCIGANPNTPLLYSTALTFDSVKQGAATLTHAVARAIHEGRKAIVDNTEVQRRAAVCCTADPTFGKCRFNKSPGNNCSTCGGVKQVLDGLLRRVSTELASCPPTAYDSQLDACAICACPLRSKICIPLDILKTHMPESQQDKLPEWCWMKG